MINLMNVLMLESIILFVVVILLWYYYGMYKFHKNRFDEQFEEDMRRFRKQREKERFERELVKKYGLEEVEE